MKRILTVLVPLVGLLAGCAGDASPEPVTSYKSYRDPVLKFAVKYPENWASSVQSGTVLYLSSPALTDAFTRTFEPGDLQGAKVEVHSMPAAASSLQDTVNAFKATFNDQGIFKSDQVSLGGAQAMRLTYAFPVGETEFKAERYYIASGNAITYLETAVFGDYAAYSSIFDSVKSGFIPGQVAVATAGNSDTAGAREVDLVAPPSDEMKQYAGAHFALSYPANFNQMTASGGKLASVKFIGERVDSYIQVDVNESSNNLQAHAEHIKGKFGAGKATTIGGQPGFVFNFKGGANATGRIYLTKAGNKLYQITVTWFTPQAGLYLPVFDKVIASFKGK